IESGSARRLASWFTDDKLFAVAPLVTKVGVEGEAARTGRTRGEMRFGRLRLWEAPVTDWSRRKALILFARRGEAAFRRSAYLALGGVDPLYASPDFGELDLALRAAKSGLWAVQDAGVTLRIGQATQDVAVPPDLRERDAILLAWRHLGNSELPRFAAHFIARLLAFSFQGQLNLRPLRYALRSFSDMARPGNVSAPTDSRPTALALDIADAPQPSARLPIPCQARGFGLFASDSHMMEAESGGVTGSAANGALQSIEQQGSALRVLLVCPQLPYPPTHGSAVRMWNLLKQLSARHEVDLLSFVEPGMPEKELADAIAAMRPYCGEIRTVARRPFDDGPSPLDRSVHVEMFDCPQMREALAEMVERSGYDVIQYDKTEMGQYLLPGPAPTQLLVEHVVFYHAYRRQFFRGIKTPLSRLVEYLKLRRYELEVCRQADGIITMSDVDSRFLRSQLPDHPWIGDVPNGVDTGYYQYGAAMPRNHDLLFIGNYYHSPNVDGVRFFLRKVFPDIKRSVPDARLVIVGPGPYHTLPEVVGETNVVCTGLVPDTRTYMGECSVLVAPILAGSGTRLKLLEAMSAGIPVVSTSLGAEGLGAVPGTHFLAADTASDFARGVVELMDTPDARDSLRRNARKLVEERFDWAVAGHRLEEAYRGPTGIPTA
ncbi:MAG TPA: glycosyltransferase family 4 protein, partial [Chloroflexota bacterium]|nr:glycosyltransferase family 4 protein [Chloroflexota bacterium]